MELGGRKTVDGGAVCKSDFGRVPKWFLGSDLVRISGDLLKGNY
jgi:hypothetical protein